MKLKTLNFVFYYKINSQTRDKKNRIKVKVRVYKIIYFGRKKNTFLSVGNVKLYHEGYVIQGMKKYSTPSQMGPDILT